MKLLTRAEVGERFGLTTRTIDKLIASGQLESLKIGRSRRIPEEAVESFVAAKREGKSNTEV